MKRKIAYSHNMKGGVLDDDYALFDNGEVLHEYDKHTYPGGQNISEILSVNQISEKVKDDFISSVSKEDLELAKKLIGR